MIKGLIDPTPTPKRLSFAQIKAWNDFVGNRNAPRETLYSEYAQKTGDKSFSLQDLSHELSLLDQKAKDRAARNSMLIGDDATVGNRFPTIRMDGKSLGVLNGDEVSEQPVQSYPEGLMASAVPDEAEVGFIEGGIPGYTDPHTGDFVRIRPELVHHPRYRGRFSALPQYQKRNEGLAASLLPLTTKK